MRTKDLDSRLCAQRLIYVLQDKQSQESYLVFIRYGTEVLLRKVFLSGNEDCQELPESSREREIIKNQASGAELSLLIPPTR